MGERWKRRYRATVLYFGPPLMVASWVLSSLIIRGSDYLPLAFVIVGTMVVAALVFMAWPYLRGRHLSESRPQSRERVKAGTRPRKGHDGHREARRGK